MSDGPRVALTFDAEHPDRPHHGAHAGWVLDELRRLGVRASVFLQGRWVEAFPDLARRVAVEGHVVGHHSFYHARMPLLSEDGFAEDVREAERVITDATGTDPRPWARFPFGAGADRADLVAQLADLGYRHIGWDVEVYEWEPGRSADEIAARARRRRARATATARSSCSTPGPTPSRRRWPRSSSGCVPPARGSSASTSSTSRPDLSPVGNPQPPIAAPTG